MAYQIFLSYRRDGADVLARLMYERLKNEGYSVFLDVESLDSGKFNEQLYDVIEQCEDFMVLLPKHGLDRCNIQEDWLRLEIEHALKYRKNIIPIIMKDFEFPEELPSTLTDLKLYQGIKVEMEFFESVIQRIKKMTISSPDIAVSEINNPQNTFLELVQDLYEIMVNYRSALKDGDQDEYIKSFQELQNVLQKIFVFSERYQYSHKDIFDKATLIINQYNQFVLPFNSFSNSVDRMSDKAQLYAKQAEDEFNDLMQIVIKIIS